jgi:hypothetical protein
MGTLTDECNGMGKQLLEMQHKINLLLVKIGIDKT